jgi:hypothetical protein
MKLVTSILNDFAGHNEWPFLPTGAAKTGTE